MHEEVRQIAGLRTTVISNGHGDKADLVVLHGYTMDTSALAPFAHSLNLGARFLFPQAPLGCAPAGYTWWPVDHEKRIAALSQGPRDLAQTHPDGRDLARASLKAFVDAARPHLPRRPLVLCGFSQGGMLACDAVLLENIEVDALVLMSSSRIAIDEWLAHSAKLRDMRILMSHGIQDDVVSIAAGEALRDFLIAAGADVTWMPFPGKHEIPLAVWRKIRQFIGAMI